MDPTPDGCRDVAGLAETLRTREPLLRRLADGPATQRELREALSVSRSTVYKALKELEEADLVVRRADGYALTRFGRVAWQRHDAYVAQLGRLEAARPLLETLPDGSPVPLSVFERARIIVAGRHAPERPLEQLEARTETADRLRCVSPAGMPRYLGELHDAVRAGELTVEIVVEAAALGRLEAGYDRFEEAAETPGLGLYSIGDELPFALVLFDDARLGLFGYGDGGLVGAAFTDDVDALHWGERTFERYRSDADRV